MCEENCLICEQCDKFFNGCQGQRGTFYSTLCPLLIIGSLANKYNEAEVADLQR